MFDELRRMALVGSGIAELTRNRAERMVKELVKTGDVRREHTGSAVRDMLEMARANRKELLSLVRGEISDQIANLGLANRRDVDRLERRVARLEDEVRKLKSDAREADKAIAAARAAADRAGTGSATASKGTARKKTTARKTAAKKTTARKTSATSKKTPAGRSPGAGKPADTGAGE